VLAQYAITPDAFEAAAINQMSPPGVVLIQLLRGLGEHGLLANLNAGDWIRQVCRNKSDPRMPYDAWIKVEACLNRLTDMNRLVTHPRGPGGLEGDDFCWLKRVLARNSADGHSPFAAVFVNDDVLELSELANEVFVNLSKALECPQWESRQRSGTLKKTEPELRNALGPFLKHARQTILIDPYMTCRSDRFFNTVQHSADLLGRGHGKQQPGRIIVHAGDPMVVGPEEHREPIEKRLERWEEALRPVCNQWGHTCQVSLWGRKSGGPNPHDRYVITDQAGVSVAGGLDVLPVDQAVRAMTTDWAFLSPKRVTEIVQTEYHHAKSPFQYLGTCKVSS